MKNQKLTIKKSIVAKFENKSNSSNQKSVSILTNVLIFR